jgi:hypothetical protein
MRVNVVKSYCFMVDFRFGEFHSGNTTMTPLGATLPGRRRPSLGFGKMEGLNANRHRCSARARAAASDMGALFMRNRAAERLSRIRAAFASHHDQRHG